MALHISTSAQLETALDGKDSLAPTSMPEPIYRQHPALAQSDLKEMRQSPLHSRVRYLASRKDNPDEESTPAQIFGRANHKIAFEPHDFDNCFCVIPEMIPVYDKNGNDTGKKEKLNRAKKSGKLFWSKFLIDNEGKTPISQADFEVIFQLRKALHEHSVANKLITNGHFETSVFAKNPEYNLMLKGRLDCWHPKPKIIVDLKTTKCAAPYSFQRDIEKYGYDLQAAFYLDLVTLATGERPNAYFILAVEKTVPYGIKVYRITPSDNCESYIVGRELYRRYLGMYKDCQDVEKWPGYSEEIVEPKVSQWRFKNEGINDDDGIEF